MYSEDQLVSFGNYLLKRYNVMVYSNDGKNEPIYERAVSHADTCNWKHDEGLKEGEIELPSQHQIGDKVNLCLMPEDSMLESFPALTAIVKAVHFFRGKVKYDLEIRFYGNMATRIYNIDSVFVLKRNE